MQQSAILQQPEFEILPGKAFSEPNPESVTLTALGDLMLAGEWDELSQKDRVGNVLQPLARACSADLVFANLEATCPGSEGTITKEPRVIGEARTMDQALAALDLDIANLANNHTFDAFYSGYEQVRDLLDKHQVASFGAGSQAAEAARPLCLEKRGQRFAFLAYTALDTRPSHVAERGSFGVHPLDEDRALVDVEQWRDKVDHLIVSLHWGVEFCHLPSPDQIRFARTLIDRGARLVIGHHAHVVQGVELRGHGAILYNLGNAVTTDLTIGGRRAIRATPSRRSSFVARAVFAADALESLELLPFQASRGEIRIGDAQARRLLQRAQKRLEEGVSPGRWKRVRLYEDVLLRILGKLHPRVIGSIRPKHFAKVFLNLWRAARGRGPA